MRKLIRNVLLIFLVVTILWKWINPVEYLSSLKNDSMHTMLMKKSSRSSVSYLLSESKWLVFSAPSFSSLLKFLFTANLETEKLEGIQENLDIRYGVKYEFLDTSNQVLISKIHHFRTAFILYEDDNKTLKSKSFYSDSSLYPSLSETLLLELKDYTDAVKIRMKVFSKDTLINDISMRSYYLEKMAEDNKNITWERMSEKQKEYLSRGNVFDTPYLTRSEKQNIVSSLWKPNGPLGIEGKDYKSRRIFFLNESESLHAYMQIQPKIYADAFLHASRYLQKGKYSIILTPTSESASSIEINYYIGKSLGQQSQYALGDTDKTISFQSREDGVLEVKSTQGVSIQIKDESSKSILHLPPVSANDYYQVDINNSLKYNFFSHHKRLIRVECRSQNFNEALLDIKMKDVKGKRVYSSSEKLIFTASKYDYTESLIVQSEPFYFYLAVPAEVNSVEFSSQSSILLRLSSRSKTVPYPVYSFFQEERPEYERLAGWFTIRPENFFKMKMNKKQHVVYKQIRPPEANVFIKEGNFQYEQLDPDTQRIAHEVLVVRPLSEEYIRSQSWKSIYSKIKVNTEHEIRFKDDIGLEYTEPKLRYHKGPGKKHVTVYIDNVVVLDKTLYAQSGVINLPAFSTGKKHSLSITAEEGLELFLSNTANSSEIYTKRRFLTFDKPMQFTFEKSDKEESIGLQLAVATGTVLDPLSFKVVVEGTETMNDLLYSSFSFKEYKVHADVSGKQVKNISYGSETLSVSSPAYIALGENLKEGIYTITVYPPKGRQKNYLHVNHISLNKRANTRINKEVL